MDGITVHALAPELDRLLSEAVLERLAMSDRQTVDLSLFTADRHKWQLSLRADGTHPALLLTKESMPGLNPPPAFTMLLRKHLRRARITGIRSLPWERVLIIECLAVDDLGDRVIRKLIFECIPRKTNLILVNGSDVIIGALRLMDHTVNRAREILPAHPYEPPPPLSQPDPVAALDLTFSDLFGERMAEEVTGRLIARTIAGFSPLLGDEVIARAGNHPDRQALVGSLHALCADIARGRFVPAVYCDRPDGSPLAVHAVALTHLPHQHRRPTVIAALTDYNRALLQTERFSHRRQAIRNQLESGIKRLQKRRQAHEGEVALGKEGPEDRLRGELILAWIHLIPKGVSHVTLDNYHEPGQRVDFPLDPALSPAENADRYFRQARRKKRKLEAATALLTRDLDELAWLDSLLAAALYAETEEDLEALEQEYQGRADRVAEREENRLPDLFPGQPASGKRRQQAMARQKGRQTRPQKGNKKDRPSSPRLFLSTDGFRISCGRNNLQNDLLLRRAGRDDWWFHAKDRPGSHVILAGAGREIPPRALEEAAVIAAWYSAAGRSGGKVEVDYCPANQVRRIPGTRPGHVRFQGHRTLQVQPLDPSKWRDESRESADPDLN